MTKARAIKLAQEGLELFLGIKVSANQIILPFDYKKNSDNFVSFNINDSKVSYSYDGYTLYVLSSQEGLYFCDLLGEEAAIVGTGILKR